MKEGKLFVVTEGVMPDRLLKSILRLTSESWREVSISKISSNDWNNIDFSEKKHVLIKSEHEGEEFRQTLEVTKAISVMWVVRRKEDLIKVNEISNRVGSLALIFGDGIEVDENIKCLCLQVKEDSDISQQLKEIDFSLRKESWRVERERRLERTRSLGILFPSRE